ncbi:unnamed protein product [Linum trigynum]|uniref:Endonuclease/exonuclease/phosphatase domain-containing protein n=1 Tax=Linum trigynum TaxID=586398 RepID=A0AAV2DA45_9ROSI
MESSILVWNMRGLCDANKRGRIKRIIGRRKPLIVGLVETKWDHCNVTSISSISGSRNYGWAAKNAVNSCGGIAAYWDQSRFRELNIKESNYFLAIELFDTMVSKYWNLVIVYGPQSRDDKIAFLLELNRLCQQLNEPICIMGDFNLVRSHDDYRGARRDWNLMMEFNEFVDNNTLMELPLGGSRFTWSRGGSNECFSRIDRAFISADFDSIYHDCTLIALERIESDHNPLLLKWGGDLRIKRPWKFENMWLEDPRFYDGLSSWYGDVISGQGMIFLCARRLQHIKNKIKHWNKEVFGDVNARISGLLTRISESDKLEEAQQLDDSQRRSRDLLKIELGRLLNLIEIS